MAQSERPRLLIVEDEPLLLEALEEEFQREGFATTPAKNGLEAIDILKSEQFALIISDIRMPKSTGIDLLKYVRSQSPSYPPVILMSGFADISNSDAYALGADSIFPKPFDIEELFCCSKRVLRYQQKKIGPRLLRKKRQPIISKWNSLRKFPIPKKHDFPWGAAVFLFP